MFELLVLIKIICLLPKKTSSQGRGGSLLKNKSEQGTSRGSGGMWSCGGSGFATTSCT